MDLTTMSLQIAFCEPGCPLCRLRQQAERRYLFNLLYENVNDGATRAHLVRGMADPEFRNSYTASAGLCLPHLRQALAVAKDELAVSCLVETAVAQLNPLGHDLGEYVRKHNWSHREEPRHPWEQVSWLRAVAFFSGEAPPADEERVSRLRRQALTDYHPRKGESKDR